MRSASAFNDAKAIHRQTGKTFYYATRLLPEHVRHATYALYAFFRVADEVVDGSSELSPNAQRHQLLDLREKALGRRDLDGSVLRAFTEVRQRYDIPDQEIEAFVDAMLADVDTDRYDTFEDLRGYMRGSAAAVGAMMTYVMEPDETEAALPHARRLGEAFQLTNFIRDVREDILELGRIYLPRKTLDTHGVDGTQIENLTFDKNVAAAIRHELRRAEALYREGVEGIRYLPRNCQFQVLLAAILYSEYHRLIRKNEFDVLSATLSLSPFQKTWLTLRTLWHWLWTNDPEAVFARVSAVPTSERPRPVEEDPLLQRR